MKINKYVLLELSAVAANTHSGTAVKIMAVLCAHVLQYMSTPDSMGWAWSVHHGNAICTAVRQRCTFLQACIRVKGMARLNSMAGLRQRDDHRTAGQSTQLASMRAECRCPAHFLSERVRVHQSAAPRPTLATSAAAYRVQADGAHVPLSAFDSSAISCWWTPQSGEHRHNGVWGRHLHRHSLYHRCATPPLAIAHFRSWLLVYGTVCRLASPRRRHCLSSGVFSNLTLL